MPDIQRTAEAVWTGGLRGGKGKLNAMTPEMREIPYTFATRFESATGTNPEELIAMAHAGCYSMAFSGVIEREGLEVREIRTTATCHLSPKPEGGFAITRMRLETRGRIPGIDQARFVELAQKGEAACPVSNLLRNCLTIELEAKLIEE